MTQPINSGAPTPVQGVTGGPGLPSGVAGVEGSTGNVVITPPSNTFQLRKGDSPQALQVYEFYHSQTDNVRIELATAVGGPEFIGVRAAPAGVIRNLRVGTTGDLILNTGSADRWTISGTTGLLSSTGAGIGFGSTSAAAGLVRFPGGNLSCLQWRNSANTADSVAIGTDNVDHFQFSVVPAHLVAAAGTNTNDLMVIVNGSLFRIPLKQ
jgi:hypothetical protein